MLGGKGNLAILIGELSDEPTHGRIDGIKQVVKVARPAVRAPRLHPVQLKQKYKIVISSKDLMRVCLVQHGASKSEQEDPQRRLTDGGVAEVQNVGNFLRSLKLAVHAVWHSGKARAQQTGELLAEAVGAGDRILQHEGLGPKDQVAAAKLALEQTAGDIMIVGHLPFLSKLIALLVTGSEEDEIVEFRFGSVVCLERRDDGKWKVAWMITPLLFDV